MGRILAIDYGKKRTGLAVTDELQIIPGGLTTVETTALVDYILNYVKSENVERIVVGLPKKLNNEYSENMVRIEPFVNRLQKLLPQMPIEYYDERFTSQLVDEVSAVIILQSYLDSKRWGK